MNYYKLVIYSLCCLTSMTINASCQPIDEPENKENSSVELPEKADVEVIKQGDLYYRVSISVYGQTAFVTKPSNDAQYDLPIVTIPDYIWYTYTSKNGMSETMQLPVIGIDSYTFVNSPKVQKVVLGKNIHALWDTGAFSNPTLSEIVFTDQFVVIDGSIFNDCPNLQEVVFNGPTYILGGTLNIDHVVFRNDSFHGLYYNETLPDELLAYLDNAGIEVKNGGIHLKNRTLTSKTTTYKNTTIDWGNGRHIVFSNDALLWFIGDKLNIPPNMQVTDNCRSITGNIETLEFGVKRNDGTDLMGTIGGSWFYEASRLRTIICRDPVPWPSQYLSFCTEWGKIDQYGEQITVYVPRESLDIYKSTYPWNRVKEILPIEGSIYDAGVDDVMADEGDDSAPTRYYNLNGAQVREGDLSAGIYIRVKGGKASKVIIQ